MNAWNAWKYFRLIGLPIWWLVTIYTITGTQDVITQVVLVILLLTTVFWWISAFHDYASAPQFCGKQIQVSGSTGTELLQSSVQRYLELQGASLVNRNPEISVFITADAGFIIGLIEDQFANTKQVKNSGSFWPRILTNEISTFILRLSRDS